ncbi:putative Valacyclovir hydrolase [Hypsibius exemplaris]|uniref:Valacyclovir hydrolase n=1 Tax=Hypsibius exemplaris TaxID=2072580 RepID=A0A1W0X4U7_HYPEX|nr:putative Valacyclovir hydrolase [Hypsibius exemplaris]
MMSATAAASPESFFTIFHSGGNRHIRYKKVGHGNHVLLLLPGAIGTIETDFGAQMNELDQSIFTLVSWDPPGYGRFGDAERIWDVKMLDTDADFAVELMRHLNVKRFSILGWSDGANTAVLIAAKYPDLVGSLVAIGGNAYADAADIQIYEDCRDVDAWAPELKEPMFDVYGREKYIRLWHNWIDTMKLIFKERDGNFCKDALDKVQARTLIVSGRDDDAVPLHHQYYFMEHIKNAELWIVSNAGHDVHLTRSKYFNAMVTTFLQAQ